MAEGRGDVRHNHRAVMSLRTHTAPRWLVVTAIALAAACAPSGPPANIVDIAREHVARHDYAGGAAAVEEYRVANGMTPAAFVALSLVAQGAASDKQWHAASRYAQQIYDQGKGVLAGRSFDQEPQLPIAMGRAIEILSQVSLARDARSEAIAFLERERLAYAGTSIEKRIQKNINLLSLEGTAPPALDLSETIGGAAPTMASLKGRVVLLFFWAHWCPDCKQQAPILAALMDKYRRRGLAIVAPTQRYGYVAGGEAAAPEVENPYIDSVRRTYYPVLAGMPIPLSAANHLRYGVSSTPTLVLVDRTGVIRLYHPGRMSQAELEPLIISLLGARG